MHAESTITPKIDSIILFCLGQDAVALENYLFERSLYLSYEEPEAGTEIDFTSCGYHPSCRVYPHRDKNWIFVCDKTVIVFVGVLGALLSAVIILSNILIVVVISRTKSLRKPQGYFKISLAMAGNLKNWYLKLLTGVDIWLISYCHFDFFLDFEKKSS